MRLFLASALLVSALLIGCTGNDDHTGFACSGATVSFSSDGCQTRITNSKCTGGRSEVRDAGTTTQLCCVFEHCATDPFPEFHSP